MNCEKAQSLMLDHLYGELPSWKAKSLMTHLKACRNCAEEFENHKNTVMNFGKLEVEEAPSALTERLEAIATREIEQEKLTEVRRFMRWKPALAMTAAAALVVISVVYYVPHEARKSVMSSKMDRLEEKVVIAKNEPMKAPAEQEKSLMIEEGWKGDYDASIGARSDKSAEIASGTISRGRAVGQEVMEGDSLAAAGSIERRQEPASPDIGGMVSTSQIAPKDSTHSSLSDDESLALRNEYTVAKREYYAAPAPESSVVASESESPEKEKAVVEKVGEDLKPGKSGIDEPEEEPLVIADGIDGRDLNVVEENKKIKDVSFSMDERLDTKFRDGLAYQESESCEKAIPIYEEILQEAPDATGTKDVYIALGECYTSLGRTEDAINIYKAMSEKYPEHSKMAQEKIEELVSQQEAHEREE